jgi:hypothetical protein
MALEAAAVLCGKSPTLCGHPARIRRTQKAFRAAKIPPNDCSDSTAALYHKENVMTDASKTSKLAIASLVMSCLTFPLGPFGFIPGIVCGHAALSEIKSDPMLRGHALAIAGLLIGYMFLSLMVILVVIGRIPLGG